LAPAENTPDLVKRVTAAALKANWRAQLPA